MMEAKQKISRVLVKDGDLYGRSAGYEQVVQALGVSYVIERTKSTLTVIPDDHRLKAMKWIEKGMSVNDARFIKQVKDYAGSLEKPKRIRPHAGSTYYFQNYEEMRQGVYENYIELDVSGAYWETALKLGYISEEIYREGFNYEKMIRLISLGALAKRTEKIRYEPPIYEMGDIKIDIPETEVFWDNISYSFSLVMTQIAGLFRGKILGFWVDALFVDSSVTAEVIEAFRQAGYELKLVRWDKIEIADIGGGKMQIVREREGERKELPSFIPGKVREQKSLRSVLEELKELAARGF